jgi:hypothetical protein
VVFLKNNHANGKMTNIFEGMLEEAVKAWSRYSPRIYLEGLWETWVKIACVLGEIWITSQIWV